MKNAQGQKWVSKFKPRHAAVGVARQVLEERMETVWHYLKLAATKPEEDVEYVHQLRVAARRAAAACKVFKNLARGKRMRQLTRDLRQLRRAAGLARDLDVLCERLKQEANSNSATDLAEAIACVEQRRRHAQKPLIRASRKWSRGKRKRKIRQLVRRELWRKSKKAERFGNVSHAVLASVVDDFFDASSADISDMEALHEMRIQGKRLRYTIEIVAGSFDKRLRKEVYPDFKEVQDRIGRVNVHATAQEIFVKWQEKVSDEEFGEIFRQLAGVEQEHTETSRQEFLEWWNTQRSEGLRKRFQLLLANDQPLDQEPHAPDAVEEEQNPNAEIEPEPPGTSP